MEWLRAGGEGRSRHRPKATGSWIDGEARNGVGILVDGIEEATRWVEGRYPAKCSGRKRRAGNWLECPSAYVDAEDGDISRGVGHKGESARWINGYRVRARARSEG